MNSHEFQEFPAVPGTGSHLIGEPVAGTSSRGNQSGTLQLRPFRLGGEARYYAIEHDGKPIGKGGLVAIDWDEGQGRIFLVLNPDLEEFAATAVELLLTEAKTIGLRSVTGECQRTSETAFWLPQIQRRPTTLKWAWSL